MKHTISLDWSRLLGFEQVSPDSKDVLVCAAKIGAKPMTRPVGTPDSVAMSRMSKIGTKNR